MKVGDRVRFTVGSSAIGDIVGSCWSKDSSDNRGSYGKKLFLVKLCAWVDPVAVHKSDLELVSPLEELAEAAE